MTHPCPPLVLFDADCGFCTATVHALGRRLRLRARTAPWQSADLGTLALTRDEASSALWFLDGEQRGSGARAVALWLGTGPPLARLAGATLQTPGVRVLAALGYRVVSRNRARIPGPWQRTCAPVTR